MQIYFRVFLAAGALLALAAPPAALASQILASITGAVYSGIDSGVFGFPLNTNLAGQNFTLTYTFDDTKGTQYVGNCADGPCFSSITSVGASNPGTAILQIGAGSFTFGVLNTTNLFSDATRQIPPHYNSEVSFVAGDGFYPDGSSVQTIIYSANGAPPLTKDYDWRGSFSDSQLSPASSVQFQISEGSFSQIVTGWLTPESVTVTGLNPVAAAPEPATCVLLISGLFVLGARTRRRRS